MILRDLLKPDARVFLKSEWAPASDEWPAVSFSQRSVGTRIRNAYQPGRDFIVYVGTGNPANTRETTHRRRLLSVVAVDHRDERKTRELIPSQSWEKAQSEHPSRWIYAFAITAAWDIEMLPLAATLVPLAYHELGNPANFGSIVELDSAELAAILDLSLRPVALSKQSAGLKVEARSRYLDASVPLKTEIYRMAAHIVHRAAASQTQSSRWSPSRGANPPVETQQMLFEKWEEQRGRCGLCHQPIPLPSAHGLLQPSADRQDSSNTSYRADNVQITHLGCNYAKHEFGVNEFEEWLAVVTDDLFVKRHWVAQAGV